MIIKGTSILTTDSNAHVYVAPFQTDFWMSIHLKNGSMNVVLTKDQARELIKSLTELVEVDHV